MCQLGIAVGAHGHGSNLVSLEGLAKSPWPFLHIDERAPGVGLDQHIQDQEKRCHRDQKQHRQEPLRHMPGIKLRPGVQIL